MEEEVKSPQEEQAEQTPQEQQAPQEQLKGIKKLIHYIKTHENIRQMVLFFLFSLICGVSQMIITLVLPIILRAADPNMSSPFEWFIFDYTEKGLGEFIGFLVGSFVGQALTFILNRKKTFNVKDHVVFRAIAYTVMAVLIILMQTAIGGGITGAFAKADPDATGIVVAIYNLIAQMVAGIAAFVVSFLGNKFVIMRKFSAHKQDDNLIVKDMIGLDQAAMAGEEPLPQEERKHRRPEDHDQGV